MMQRTLESIKFKAMARRRDKIATMHSMKALND
jgi:hypothetical protein